MLTPPIPAPGRSFALLGVPYTRAMAASADLEALWNSAGPASCTFDPARVSAVPDGARRYLEHAIAPGTPLASAVRLQMHGEIKLGHWLPFKAEQVIHRERGMIWRAAVRMNGMPVRGFDRLLNGSGEMRWKLLGIVPVMRAAGPDITRSAAGRMMAESVWLPSMFCGDGVAWRSGDGPGAAARLTMAGETGEVALDIGDEGRLNRVRMRRWGNPGGAFRYEDFGGIAARERAFGGYTIPISLRAGWYFGSPRFETEGEFFRVTVDDAAYR